MKSVLLIGLGRFGKNIAEKLVELKHDVLAVDIDEERVNDILPLVTSAQIGDCANEEFLKTLGVRDFDVCIVTIRNNFESSLQTTSLLKELGAKFVVARAESEVHEKFLLRNGADATVFPEKQLALWTALKYTSNNLLDYIKLDDTYSIYEVDVPSEWEGHTVRELDIRRKYNINVLAVKHGGKLEMTINPDEVLTPEDTFLVIGTYKDVKHIFKI